MSLMSVPIPEGATIGVPGTVEGPTPAQSTHAIIPIPQGATGPSIAPDKTQKTGNAEGSWDDPGFVSGVVNDVENAGKTILTNLATPTYQKLNADHSAAWDASIQAKNRMMESAKQGDTLGVMQHAAGMIPIAAQVDAAMTNYQKDPSHENLAHVVTAAIPAFLPSMMRGAKALTQELPVGAGTAGEVSEGTEAEASKPSPVESEAAKSVKKAELEPGKSGSPAQTVKTPARIVKTEGTEPQPAPTGTMHEPVLQNSVRQQVNKVAADEGLKPIEDKTDLRDVGKDLANQFYARSKAGFDAVKKATGIDVNVLRDQISDLYSKKAEVFSDPDKEGALIEKINELEEQANGAFEQAKAQGVDVDKPLSDWRKMNATSDYGEQVRSSVDPLQKSGTFDPSKYAPRLEKLYRSDPRYPGRYDTETGTFTENPSRLEQVFGKQGSETMRDDAYAASETQQAVKNFKPEPGTPGTTTKIPASTTKTPAIPPTESKALYELVRPNVKGKVLLDGAKTNWNKVLQDFDKLSPEEAAARFKNPDQIRDLIHSQARKQFLTTAAKVGGAAAAATYLGLSKTILHAAAE